MTRRLLEHEVSCDVCGAKEGEYCRKSNGNRLFDQIHVIRKRKYDILVNEQKE